MRLGNVFGAVALGFTLLLSAASAHAETFSVGARLGYFVATGDAAKGAPLKDTASGVVPLQIDALYYLGLGFSVGAYGSYGVLTGLPDNIDSGRQTRLGAQAQFVLPLPAIKPWAAAGIGYEWLSFDRQFNNTKTESTTNGLELFNLSAGLKFTALPILSIGPYVQYQRATFSKGNSPVGEADIPDALRSAHGWLGGGVRAEASF